MPVKYSPQIPCTALSQSVSHWLPGRQYRIASLPKGMEITYNGFRITERVPTIAVIDVFSAAALVYIHYDTLVYHGDIVTKYAVHGLKDRIGVLAFDTTPSPLDRDSLTEYRALNEALKDLAAIQKQHHNITALNLSVGMCCKYRKLSSFFKTDFSALNIEQKKDTLLDFLSKERNEKYALAYQMIMSINSLVDDGVTIYNASGNMGERGIDLFSLSRAQHIVTAPDYSRATKAFSTDAASGVHIFGKKFNDSNRLQCITDGLIEFTSEFFFYESFSDKKGLLDCIFPTTKVVGTSFACPLKLNQDLRAMLNPE